MKWRQWQQVKGKRPFHRSWWLQSVLRRSFSQLAVQQGDNVIFWGVEKENDNIHNHWLLIINYGQVCNLIPKDKVNKIWVDKGECDSLRMLLIIHLIITILILMILIFCLSKDLSDRGLRFSGPPPTTLPTKSSTLLPTNSSHQIQLNTNTVCLRNKCSFILFTPNSKMLQEHVIVGIWTTRAEKGKTSTHVKKRLTVILMYGIIQACWVAGGSRAIFDQIGISGGGSVFCDHRREKNHKMKKGFRQLLNDISCKYSTTGDSSPLRGNKSLLSVPFLEKGYLK